MQFPVCGIKKTWSFYNEIREGLLLLTLMKDNREMIMMNVVKIKIVIIGQISKNWTIITGNDLLWSWRCCLAIATIIRELNEEKKVLLLLLNDAQKIYMIRRQMKRIIYHILRWNINTVWRMNLLLRKKESLWEAIQLEFGAFWMMNRRRREKLWTIT